MCSRQWVLLIATILYYASKTLAQQDILSISSYNYCIELGDNKTQSLNTSYLDCSGGPDSEQGWPITTIDLRLVASAISESSFIVDLTTVPDIHNSHRPNDNPNPRICGADPTKPQNCVTTTPVSITVESTEYIYYYNLHEVATVVPQYCYMGRFATINTEHLTIDNNKQKVSPLSGTELCYQNDVVNYCGNTDSSRCADLADTYSQENLRIVSQVIDKEALNRGKGEYYYKWASANKHDPYTSPTHPVGEFRDTILSFDSIRRGPKPCLYNQPSPSPNPTFNSISRDDHPVIGEYPVPEPFPEGVASKLVFGYGDVLQSTMCSGYQCGGIYDAVAYKNYSTTSRKVVERDTDGNVKDACQRDDPQDIFYAYNARDGAIDGNNEPKKQKNVGTIGMILELYSLGPECVLYSIDETPSVAVKITINVTNLNSTDPVNSNGKSNTQTVYISNLVGLPKQASPEKTVGARVISVDTLDGYIGPALPGYIIQCGKPDQVPATEPTFNDFSDPREVQYDDGSRNAPPADAEEQYNKADIAGKKKLAFLDMRRYVVQDGPENNTDYDPTTNPWEYIKERLPVQGGYYPTGKALDINPFDKPARNSMWYYVDILNDAWLGPGCNQLGMTDEFWNTNFNGGSPNSDTGLEQCYLSPFMCMPGYSNESFGGRSIPGCLASAAFIAKRREGVFGLDTDQFDYNGEQIEEIVKKSVPPYYNPQDPNYWPVILEGVGMALAFDPKKSKSPDAISMPPVSFELTIELVGSFVEYISNVSNGEIVAIDCHNGSADPGVINRANVTVKNVGTIPGTYTLDIDCPKESEVTIDGQISNTPVINPGEKGVSFFDYSTTVPGDELPTDQNACVINLMPGGGDAFTILSTMLFTCDLVDPDDPDGDVEFRVYVRYTRKEQQ